jgi:hypothetical protein
MKTAENARPRRVAEFRLEELDGELLLYHPGLTRTLYCNPTAALVWRLADGSRSAADIAALLADAYPDLPVADDVTRALGEFDQRGAIEWV